MRFDLTLIQPWINEGSRVLDLGCGDGTLLATLAKQKNVSGVGLEIDPENITQSLAQGVNVIEHDLNLGLGNFRDNSFDMVVMTLALQTLRYPHLVIDEMLRVGRECIVTFPNFGHWRSRWYLSQRGKMPVSKFLPYTWYDTPNIHFCTVKDFEALCADKQIRVLNSAVIGADNNQSSLADRFPNLLGVTAVYHISK
ncbi:methionine biosynthesis protein MetW [gamma proteobacterium BDW918]|jgi:methionine biosynthesis protein MetW|uniref:Methionine biosynthesis protein MetW n=1 Tax=Zhongshania aliphaticivorans TaxID=1470434 RepID=A0A127M9R6_9GAMM|nr:methionine biosynthesis protein MetW [Zhongshania aliphaticivorans]AMO69970.1 methionine biosynthesis protein MetW [Zhongshania aliphaticivorans]EIF41830.1 methionine biosynthesis protein MetW [gamma proteobacterium BDW918]